MVRIRRFKRPRSISAGFDILGHLPYDNQERILAECVFGGDFDKRTLSSIGLVSKQWRDVLLAAHRAWSRIDFVGGHNLIWNSGAHHIKALTTVNELQGWLRNAGTHILDISLRHNNLAVGNNSLNRILGIIFAHATRIRRIHLDIDLSFHPFANPGSTELGAALQLLSTPLSDLQVLSLRHDLRSNDLRSLTSAPGPSLVSLLRSDPGHPWPALTTLEIPVTVFMEVVLPRGPAFIPAVRTLAVHGSILSARDMVMTTTYPNVTTLSLRTSRVGHVLRHLYMPNLRVLMLGDERRVVSLQEWGWACQFLSGPRPPPLIELYLDSVQAKARALILGLFRLRVLKRLVWVNAEHTGDFVRDLTTAPVCRALEELAIMPSPCWVGSKERDLDPELALTLASTRMEDGRRLRKCSMGNETLRNLDQDDEGTWYWETEGTPAWWSVLECERSHELSVHAAESGAA
ncbi:hypothetical protein AURDEDRAFT_161211 [Auricularia subglabra TFB-10046 SS5]|nr:hypothetical protein AURDEDRAFT_161211 [Auricularia subglabra TFB-10046 SS5]